MKKLILISMLAMGCGQDPLSAFKSECGFDLKTNGASYGAMVTEYDCDRVPSGGTFNLAFYADGNSYVKDGADFYSTFWNPDSNCNLESENGLKRWVFENIITNESGDWISFDVTYYDDSISYQSGIRQFSCTTDLTPEGI